jgi:hypothetical protein
MKSWKGIMFSKRAITLFALILITAFGASCGRREEATTPAGPVWKPTGNEGNIVGTIAFTGEVPAPRKLDMSQDAACQQMGEGYVEDVVVKNGKLHNAFVYVKSGLPPMTFEVPPEAILDQKGCKYVPRVLGLQTGQVLKITNSDPTDHNIHPVPQKNNEWNQSQLAGQGPITRKFSREETMVRIKCDRHPWMIAWAGVLAHPFYAVSGPNGTFAIKGLPPGEYELEAWHEKFGTKTTKVKVGEQADAKADFTFDTATN